MKSWQVNAQQVNKNHPINQLERRNLGSHSKNLIYPPTHPKTNTKSPLKIGSVCPTTRWKQRIVFQSHHWLFRGNLLGLGSCRPCHSNPNSFFFPVQGRKSFVIIGDPWLCMQGRPLPSLFLRIPDDIVGCAFACITRWLL